MSEREARRGLYCLVVAAMGLAALGLFVVVPAVTGIASSHYQLGFTDDYHLIGRSVAEGEGYRLSGELAETMIREPGYPLLLAAAFRLFGFGLEGARAANVLLAGAAAVLLWHLALRVVRDPAAALAAVALFLLYPAILVAQARGGVEMLFLCGALAFMVLLYRAIQTERAGAYFLAGVALGALVLVRSTPLLFPAALVPYLLLAAPAGARSRRLAHCGLLLAGMALALAPWVLRNYALSGLIVPTATVLGVAMQEGQYTCERLSFGRNHQVLQREAAAQRNALAAALGLRFRPGFYQYFHTPADEVAFNRALLERSLARYREQPGLLARCVGQNLLHFWFLGKNGLATALNVALQLPLIAVALAGWWTLRRCTSAWAPLALFAAYLVAVHLPVMAHARHAVPLVPFLALFAGLALVAAWRRFGAVAPSRAHATAR